MNYRQLGQTDLRVSTVAIGCWQFAGDMTWGDQDERDSIAAVHTALEHGINFFDTAELYGDGLSERVLGKALKGHRDQAVIASKAGVENLSAQALRRSCERSLRNLGTDWIDLYQLHWPSRETPFEETAEAMDRLIQEGKVRCAGVANFGAIDLNDIVRHMTVATNQLAYSLLFRAVEFEVLPTCLEHKAGVLCYSPLQQSLLTGKFSSAAEVPDGRARGRLFSGKRPHSRHGEAGHEEETFRALERIRAICERINQPMAAVALAWLLHQPGVTSVLVGARNADQSRINALAGDLQLDEALDGELSETTEVLKQAMGPNCDLWQADSRLR